MTPAVTAPNARQIRSVQQILLINGFDCPVDGVVGPKTLAAIDTITGTLSEFRSFFTPSHGSEEHDQPRITTQ